MPAPTKKLNTDEEAPVKSITEFAGPNVEETAAAAPAPAPAPAPFDGPKEMNGRPEVSAPYAGPGAFLPESNLYNVGDWAGHANYECKLCPYSTLEKESMLSHIIERHSGVESKVIKSTHS